MAARSLPGAPVREAIVAKLIPRIQALPRQPGLAVVLVGHDPASEIYVRNKVKACADLGIFSEKLTPSASSTTEELLAVIDGLNRQDEIDGILVQMPLPSHIDSKRILLAIDPAKDVDGFHPVSVGNLVANRPGPRACTPAGIIRLLQHYEIEMSGKHAVVVGRSDTVGKPMAMLLLHQNATVTICHSKTRDLPGTCRQADILVAAIGRPAMIDEKYIGDGAVVIDVGINRLDSREAVDEIFRGDTVKLDAFQAKGNVLVGDAHPLDAAAKASAYTPVPGGVGILTVTMLMENTVELAEQRIGVSKHASR